MGDIEKYVPREPDSNDLGDKNPTTGNTKEGVSLFSLLVVAGVAVLVLGALTHSSSSTTRTEEDDDDDDDDLARLVKRRRERTWDGDEKSDVGAVVSVTATTPLPATLAECLEEGIVFPTRGDRRDGRAVAQPSTTATDTPIWMWVVIATLVTTLVALIFSFAHRDHPTQPEIGAISASARSTPPPPHRR